MSKTSIEWTDDTWNPVVGCSIVSPGCHNCYAMPMAFRLRAMALADIAAGRDPGKKRHYIDAVDDNGRWTGKLVPVPESLTDPIEWSKPRMAFVNSMSDLFHESLPFEFIDRVFASMGIANRHTFQVLTKRGDRLEEYFDQDIEDLWQRWGVAAGDLLDGDWIWNAGKRHRSRIERFMSVAMGEVLDDEPEITSEEMNRTDSPMANVWLGVSVENRKQRTRIDHLRNVPAAVRFLSCEPLLEDIGHLDLTGIGWVIAGGESGHESRPCRPEWIRVIATQCRITGVPCFVKQMGGNVVTRNDMIEDVFNDGHSGWPDPNVEHHIHGFLEEFQGADCRIRLRDRKGGDWSEWPEDLRIRQMPTTAVTA